jgi:hypothetical protein
MSVFPETRPFACFVPTHHQRNATVRKIVGDKLPAAVSPEAKQQKPQEPAMRHHGDSFRWLARDLAPDRPYTAVYGTKGIGRGWRKEHARIGVEEEVPQDKLISSLSEQHRFEFTEILDNLGGQAGGLAQCGSCSNGTRQGTCIEAIKGSFRQVLCKMLCLYHPSGSQRRLSVIAEQGIECAPAESGVERHVIQQHVEFALRVTNQINLHGSLIHSSFFSDRQCAYYKVILERGQPAARPTSNVSETRGNRSELHAFSSFYRHKTLLLVGSFS